MTDARHTHRGAIGVAHFSAIQLPPQEFVRQAAAAGFGAVGLRLHPAFAGASYYELPQGSRAASEFRSVLDGEGIRVFDIEFFIIGPDFDAASVEHIVAAAADMGAQRLSACGDDADRERLMDNFSAFCELAGRHGMAVDIENMGWRAVSSYSQSAALVRACGLENAGALVDAIHFFRNGGNVDEIDAGIVRHVQLCDVAGPPPKTADDMMNEARTGRLAPGDGILPLGDMLAKLAGNAAISVEVPLVGETPASVHLRNLNLKTRKILEAEA